MASDDDRSFDLRNRIATARAWGDVAARDALHHGTPQRAIVENVIVAWEEILDEISKTEE